MIDIDVLVSCVFFGAALALSVMQNKLYNRLMGFAALFAIMFYLSISDIPHTLEYVLPADWTPVEWFVNTGKKVALVLQGLVVLVLAITLDLNDIKKVSGQLGVTNKRVKDASKGN